MKSDIIYNELIQLDWEVKNQEDFFERIGEKLLKRGFVKETFLDAIKVRENEYPTALNIKPYPIAIPHVDPIHIVKPFIAATRLKNGIKWCEMATNDVEHEVKLIFMLGFLKSNDHIILLQTLLENCQQNDVIDKLFDSQTETEYGAVLLEMKEVEM